MNIFNKFCCCIDLRKGCVIYAWWQMIFVTLLTTSVVWISNSIKAETTQFPPTLVAGQFDLISAIQIIKILTCFSLIWGLVKTHYMFYEPWLFINAVENIILIILMLVFFVLGFIFSFEIIIFLCTPLLILLGIGCYVWSRVYIVYKRDKNMKNIDLNS